MRAPFPLFINHPSGFFFFFRMFRGLNFICCREQKLNESQTGAAVSCYNFPSTSMHKLIGLSYLFTVPGVNKARNSSIRQWVTVEERLAALKEPNSLSCFFSYFCHVYRVPTETRCFAVVFIHLQLSRSVILCSSSSMR